MLHATVLDRFAQMLGSLNRPLPSLRAHVQTDFMSVVRLMHLNLAPCMFRGDLSKDRLIFINIDQ